MSVKYNHKRASKRAQKRRGTQLYLPFDETPDLRNATEATIADIRRAFQLPKGKP